MSKSTPAHPRDDIARPSRDRDWHTPGDHDTKRWGHPRVFVVCGADGFLERHEGYTLSLDDVLTFLTGVSGGDDGSGDDWDLAIFECVPRGAKILRAIGHRRPGQPFTVTRLDEPGSAEGGAP